MRYVLTLFLIIMNSQVMASSLDYSIKNGQFSTSSGLIPKGCIAQLSTELNGDDVVASVFITRTSLRGCQNSNIPYWLDEASLTYTINQSLGNNQYKVSVCQNVEGNMRRFCDAILVKFVVKEYHCKDSIKSVLTLEKLGTW